jgi:predicted permease
VFAIGVVVTLALGIAVNAAMFDVLDRLLLRPPAHVREPSRVIRVYLHTRSGSTEALSTEVSYRRFQELRGSAQNAVDLAAFYEGPVVAGAREAARYVSGALVSGNFWTMLGVRPALGRFFDDATESAFGNELVAVLGHEYWATGFGADSGVIGRSIDVGSRSFMIVGVAPRGFAGVSLSRVDVWLPSRAAPAIFSQLDGDWARGNGFIWLSLVGRIRDGTSAAGAASVLTTSYQRSLELARKKTDVREVGRASVWPAHLERGPERGDGTRVAVWVGAVAVIVMLLACANVANLMLARALRRRGEIAVRVALGASRGRLVRQLLIESVLLAAVSTVAGAVLAVTAGGALRAILLPGVALADAAVVNLRLLAFVSFAGIVACIASGLGPALYASRPDLAGMLNAVTRASTPRAGIRTVLLIGQAAMSTVLLVGAGLFVRSLSQARSTDMGFDAERLLVVRLQLRNRQAAPGDAPRVLREFAERLRSVPGVEGVTTTLQVPFSTSGSVAIAVPGIDSVARFGEFLSNAVGKDYFRTTGTRIIGGRALDNTDRLGSPLVLVVSDSMARVLWPGRSAVGQCVKIGGVDEPCSQVVGVAANIHQYEVRSENALQYWTPEAQSQRLNTGPYAVLVRAANPTTMASAVRRALVDITPPSGLVTVRPLAASIERVVRPWRLGAVMFGVFGAVGLLIAVVGLYSVLAYAVDQRRRELGVRVALGAGTARLAGLVVAQSMTVAGVGIVIGLLAAFLAAPWLRPLLIGVGPRNPAVLTLVSLTLLLAAFAASLIPAWRAARVDPIEVLRTE